MAIRPVGSGQHYVPAWSHEDTPAHPPSGSNHPAVPGGTPEGDPAEPSSGPSQPAVSPEDDPAYAQAMYQFKDTFCSKFFSDQKDTIENSAKFLTQPPDPDDDDDADTDS